MPPKRFRSLVATVALTLIALVAGESNAVSLAASTDRADAPVPGLRATMFGGNTYGDQVRESNPRADGYRHVDTPQLIAKLKATNASLYLFQVWNSPTDWADLTQEFAPAAQAAGIQVWPYIVPPSECQYFEPDGQPLPRLKRGRCSQPYGLDYVRWAEEVAKLSKRYSVVTGWGIDDFYLGNQSTFTREYMTRMVAAQDAVNPDLRLYTTAYLGHAASEDFYKMYGDFIDGIIYPYLGLRHETADASELGQALDMIEPFTKAHGVDLMLLMYANRYVNPRPHPNDRYIDQLLDTARGRLTSGQIDGVIAYGMPMDGKPALNTDARSHDGVGRLSLSVSGWTDQGAYASASQRVSVRPGDEPKVLEFWHNDWLTRTPAAWRGYQFLEVLVDGKVAWSRDVMGGNLDEWTQSRVDLTEALRGKSAATLTFRLYQRQAVGCCFMPIDLGVDGVKGTGITLANGDFEKLTDWSLFDSDGGVEAILDLWSSDLQQKIAHTVASHYAEMAGKPRPGYGPKPAVPPVNRTSMYGRGRLSLSVDDFARTTAGQCATATQSVAVKPSPRYELSFWHYDQWFAAEVAGQYRKQVLVDDTVVYDSDIAEGFGHNDWTQGAPLQGPIDITELVSGRSRATVTFKLCATANVTDLPVDVGFDNITTVGLPLVNPGFDTRDGWRLSSTANVKAAIDL